MMTGKKTIISGKYLSLPSEVMEVICKMSGRYPDNEGGLVLMHKSPFIGQKIVILYILRKIAD